ncbi:Tat pathway signal protein [Streptomyces ipomoeae]|uniref:Tat pathway signal protein n=1 Tax=Streptomyces ipomoeae TaxID=103232 RepID=UPI0029B59A86|nr:Tat pathway signal protein [Streptomyces ipomoeae]MDX2819934.1 Tat pathway signal protein [Streptomyces ipomoeae]MDX2872620.1 Tat pathway signal protein [Streptomyces ipomoeae]
MAGTRNHALAAWMDKQQMDAGELADCVNNALAQLTGAEGKASERLVYRWLSGENQWPQAKYQQALVMVTGRSITDLGFVPRSGGTGGPAPREGRVKRRAFMTATGGTALALATSAPAAARPTVGTSDVLRLRGELARLYLMDDEQGGTTALENAALGLVEETRGLQQNGSATQKTRSRLYALAAAFTATAMWAAVDSRRLDDAQAHLNSAIHLAGLSGDGQVQHQIWRYAAMLADQRGRYADSVAAAEAAMNTRAHRTDPLYASLSHARLALSAASAGDRPRAVRAMTRAADAFGRAELARPRPASMDFYTLGELHGLTGITHYRLGHGENAEFHTHQALAALRPEQHRNRAYYTAQTALAQLQQGEAEQACATATTVIPEPGATTGRVSHLLGTFTASLTMRAPGAAITRAWTERVRTA